MEQDFSNLFDGGQLEDDNKYLRTDEFQDVHASLLLLEISLQKAKQNPAFWKWAILSAHSAVQGACVCLLSKTDKRGALSKQNQKALWAYDQFESQKAITENSGGEWILEDVKYPNAYLADLPEFLCRLPDELKVDKLNSSDKASKVQRNIDFDKLHQFRNKFTHFESISWSLEISGLPRILEEALTLSEKIINADDKFGRVNRFDKTTILPVIEACRTQLNELSLNSSSS